MDPETELLELRKRLTDAGHIQTELDRRIYYLRTLYDVSKDIFGNVEYTPILKNFLLMAMGNFGVLEGFILTLNVSLREIDGFASIGFKHDAVPLLKSSGSKVLLSDDFETFVQNRGDRHTQQQLPDTTIRVFPFSLDEDHRGILGLGGRLIDQAYSADDDELIFTLVNSLVVALKNARSFEEIRDLNLDLKEKNAELERTLSELQAALRKIEILEDIKANLSKFVPVTVSRLIETAPGSSIPEGKEQDVSVLFLDIQGSTVMSEKLGDQAVNELIEQYFSVFMDAIYANNGDVNETAGDGLMVLFLDEDKKTNAMEAVETALAILEEAAAINSKNGALSESLIINMGVNSGLAPVGASRFESLTGSRWTYTARGLVTIIAKRIGDVATDGSVLISQFTAGRIGNRFVTQSLGAFDLKNVSDSVEIFQVEGRAL